MKECNPYHYGILVISPGELADKLSILQIKRERIPGDSSNYIQEEICRVSFLLDKILAENSDLTEEFYTLLEELRIINIKQWDFEDRVRTENSWEAAQAARNNNTDRVNKKNEINTLFKYPVEQKLYKEKPNGG